MIDRNWINTDLYKNAELKTYASATSLSKATGIPKKLLLIASKQNCEGFESNNRINWSKARAPFEVMLDNLEAKADDDLSFWTKENKKKDVALKELQIKKLEKNLIEPEEVRQLMVELATKQSVVLKRIFGELPPKVAGKGEADCKIILDEALKNIFTVLQNKIDEWK